MSDSLTASIAHHLETLCNRLGNRHVGSPGNRRATDYAEQMLASYGWTTRTRDFACMEWTCGDVQLVASGRLWHATVGPYSLPFQGTGELVAVSSLDALASTNIAGRIVLLHGEIAREQVMPKNFVFYNPDHHKRLVSLLEKGQPAALVCATGRNPGTAGSVYPFPLFEDGDFDIPSVTMKDVDGAQLLGHAGESIRLSFESRRIPSTGTNVVARLGTSGAGHILLCAHIDAKKNTPGALDNASGVATLLGLAELLNGLKARIPIEIVLFNGEDYYAVPGQMQYLAELGAQIAHIDLVINLDGAGHRDARIAYSFYEAPDAIRDGAQAAFADDPMFMEGAPWVQGDHTMFVMAGRPAIAITSENFDWLCQEITHTPRDSADRVDPEKLAKTAQALQRLIKNLGGI